MSFLISFLPQGRTGNNFFQYITCKLIELLFKNHKYTYDSNLIKEKDHIILDETLYKELTESEDIHSDPKFFKLKETNILCEGYFQIDTLLIKHRYELLNIFDISDDIFENYIGYTDKKSLKVNTYLRSSSDIKIKDNDIVISLRLGDYYYNNNNPGNSTSVIHPYYYLNILKNLSFDKVIIVCDKIKETWEKNYIRFFDKYKPILIQGSLENDCAILRNCKRLIHSNSTLCWFMSYMSHKVERYIPNYSFADTQKLGKICPEDYMFNPAIMASEAIDILQLFEV